MSGRETTTCPCGKQVFDALHNGVAKPMDATAHTDGIYSVMDTGGDIPVARRLTTAQQFGRQGTLYQIHKCTIKKRGAHKW